MVLQGVEFECAWKAALRKPVEHEPPRKPARKKKGVLQCVEQNLQVAANCSTKAVRKLHTRRLLSCDSSDLL